MNIWAIKGPPQSDYDTVEYSEVIDFLSSSIRNGISRCGWGNIETADLRVLNGKSWDEMTKDEMLCWNKANFLLGIRKGDWIIHINVPHWGACLTGQVVEEYYFEYPNNKLSDYRHILRLDNTTIFEFERNDERVHPIFASRLKLQGRFWTISFHDEFLQTIENFSNQAFSKTEKDSVGIFYLKQDLSPLFKNVTNMIQKTHPGGSLEGLIADVFRNVPNVTNVSEHGKHKGWGTDNGADLIVTYKSGLSLCNLEKVEKLVVQVKSYTGQHWETNAVDQIVTAIKEFDAASGLIITTAHSTDILEKAIENRSDEIGKPIGLIAGENVAKFVLTYGGGLIL